MFVVFDFCFYISNSRKLKTIFLHEFNVIVECFQKAREAWVTSVFVLGLSQKTGATYWIEENPIPQDDPDLFVYSYRNPKTHGEIGVVKEIQPVEVCEYPPQSKLKLDDHIKNKLKKPNNVDKLAMKKLWK